MWVRKRLDIRWSDLGHGLVACLIAGSERKLRERLEASWSASKASDALDVSSAAPDTPNEPADAVACLSVRSGFDLLLSALDLPPGSEVLVSALTIPDMVRIIEAHGLVAVPVDVDEETLTPQVDSIHRATNSRTRAILVAHLLGSRFDMRPIAEVASALGLLLLEDCAQAFAGDTYRGHPAADVSMFSFGPIKASTALGGALLRVHDAPLRRRVLRAQQLSPRQSRFRFFRRLAKYTMLKMLSKRALFTLIVRCTPYLGIDPDRLVKSSVRGFTDQRFFQNIRRRPSAPLLSLMQRRVDRYDRERAARQTQFGQLLADVLGNRVASPTATMSPHTYWVSTVLATRPERLIEPLRAAGYDATQSSSFIVVAPPADRPELRPETAESVLRRMVFVPCYPEMGEAEVRRMAAILLEHASVASPVGRRLHDLSPAPAGSTLSVGR